jgi:hypothetical protein
VLSAVWQFPAGERRDKGICLPLQRLGEHAPRALARELRQSERRSNRPGEMGRRWYSSFMAYRSLQRFWQSQQPSGHTTLLTPSLPISPHSSLHSTLAPVERDQEAVDRLEGAGRDGAEDPRNSA